MATKKNNVMTNQILNKYETTYLGAKEKISTNKNAKPSDIIVSIEDELWKQCIEMSGLERSLRETEKAILPIIEDEKINFDKGKEAEIRKAFEMLGSFADHISSYEKQIMYNFTLLELLNAANAYLNVDYYTDLYFADYAKGQNGSLDRKATMLDGTVANAFKHATWNALMTKSIGEEKAAQIANAHESKLENVLYSPYLDTFEAEHAAMDLYYNNLGRKIASQEGIRISDTELAEKIYIAVIEDQSRVLISSPEEFLELTQKSYDKQMGE